MRLRKPSDGRCAIKLTTSPKQSAAKIACLLHARFGANPESPPGHPRAERRACHALIDNPVRQMGCVGKLRRWKNHSRLVGLRGTLSRSRSRIRQADWGGSIPRAKTKFPRPPCPAHRRSFGNWCKLRPAHRLQQAIRPSKRRSLCAFRTSCEGQEW
jgi:hypothetical protein